MAFGDAADDDPLDLLAALVARFDSADETMQDRAMSAAETLANRLWGGYSAGMMALAARVEGQGGDPVAAALSSLRLRAEAEAPGHLIAAARRRRSAGEPQAAPPAAAEGEIPPVDRALIAAGQPFADPGEDPADPFASLAGWAVPWHPLPVALRTAVAAAWPLPATVAAARDEARMWEKRQLRTAGRPQPALPTACAARHRLVCDLWRSDLPVDCAEDFAARLDYWAERGEGDAGGFAILRDDFARLAGRDPPSGGRHDAVCRLRAEHPDWSLARLGAALGISRQAVHKHLRRAAAGVSPGRRDGRPEPGPDVPPGPVGQE